jgi:hypothetical protein
LLASHHANNYTGAVKRLNAIRAQVAALDFTSAPGFQVNELKREELVATNSMLLHELLLDSLGGDGPDDDAGPRGQLRQRRALALRVRGNGQEPRAAVRVGYC